MTAPGGFGRQGFGLRAFGAGGPLTVVRALAVAGQVVRVVFSEEPLHRSPAGRADALNPSNYVLTVPGGNAIAPIAMGVDRDPVEGPARGVGNGAGTSAERGIDVHLDRQVVVGVQYSVRVRNVEAMAGGALGTPDTALFLGVTLLEETRLPERNQDLVDLANPPWVGHLIIDDSGDVAPEDPDEGLRKRVYRRLTTPKGAFTFLPRDYGVGFDHKSPAQPAVLSAKRVDAIQQLRQEPDVVDADVQIQVMATGVVIIKTQVKSRRGTFVRNGLQVSATGEVSPMEA